jgi:hypothetical protein
MKNRATVFLLTWAFSFTLSYAYDFEVGGIYYNIIYGTRNVEVTHDGSYSNYYSGEIKIPATVTYDEVVYDVVSIGFAAFNNCSRLTSITLPESIISLDNWAFMSCKSLISITLPNSVTSIGSQAFASTGLTSITIPNSVTSIGTYVFSGCMGLTSVTVPGNIKSITRGAFSNCYELLSVIIQEGVESIGDYTFDACHRLKSVAISKSITSFGYNAFRFCESLQEVEVQWDAPASVPVWDDMFEGVDLSRVTLIVPAGTKSLYQAANVWKDFGTVRAVANMPIGAIDVTCSNGILNVNTVNAEKVFIYSVSGVLLWSADKPAHPTAYNIGNLRHGVIIACGSSGWILKLIL